MNWSVETLSPVVDQELNALPADQKARFLRIAELIKAKGLERVREPYVKHIEVPLWEIRMKGRDGNRPQGGGGPGLREEDPKIPAP